jgi:hypothetical protein
MAPCALGRHTGRATPNTENINTNIDTIDDLDMTEEKKKSRKELKERQKKEKFEKELRTLGAKIDERPHSNEEKKGDNG